MTVHLSGGRTTRVTNADTGEEIPGLAGCKFTLHWDSPEDDQRVAPFIGLQPFVAQLLDEARPLLKDQEERS